MENTKLREEWIAEFFDFYNFSTLTPEEVTKGMGKGYTQADLPEGISEKFAYMTALVTADETQVEACRKFISENCSPEYLKVFDIYWAGNDEKRQERIAELSLLQASLHTGAEAKDYAGDGSSAYADIGQIYNSMKGNESIKNKGRV